MNYNSLALNLDGDPIEISFQIIFFIQLQIDLHYKTAASISQLN